MWWTCRETVCTFTALISLSLVALAKDKSHQSFLQSTDQIASGVGSIYIDVGPAGTTVDGYRSPSGAVGAIVSYGNGKPVWIFPNGAKPKSRQQARFTGQSYDIPEIPFSKSDKGRIISVDDHYATFKNHLQNEPNSVVLLVFYIPGAPATRILANLIDRDLIYANKGKISLYQVIIEEGSGAAISTRDQYRDTIEKGMPAVFLLAPDKDGDWAIVDEDSGLPQHLSGKRFNDLATYFAARFAKRRQSASENIEKAEEIILLPPKEE